MMFLFTMTLNYHGTAMGNREMRGEKEKKYFYLGCVTVSETFLVNMRWNIHPRKRTLLFFVDPCFCSFWYFLITPWSISKSLQDIFSALSSDQYRHCGPKYTSENEQKHCFCSELVGKDVFFCMCYNA